MMKRWLAMALAVCMLLGCLPQRAYAEENAVESAEASVPAEATEEIPEEDSAPADTTPSEDTVPTEDTLPTEDVLAAEEPVSVLLDSDAGSVASVDAAAASGACGDGLTWTLTEDGTLTISGTGSMYDYTQSAYEGLGRAPWDAYYTDISPVTVVVEEGVTSIGANAFCAESITSFSLPATLESIGEYAFAYNDSLTALTIPEGVTAIGACALVEMDGLTELYMPASLESVDSTALDYYTCQNLAITYGGTIAQWQTLGIGQGSVSCADGAILDSGLITTGITYMLSDQGVMTVSGEGAFEAYQFSNQTYDTVTSMVIQEGITGAGIWNHCFPNLTSITIPRTLTDLEIQGNTVETLLTQVHISDLGAWCSIDFGSGYGNPLYLGAELYLNGELVTDVVVPEGTAAIGSHVFYNYDSLRSVTIPESVQSVGEGAFEGCDYASITYEGTMEQWIAIANVAKKTTCSDGVIFGCGTCGDDVRWVMDESGLLTISGTGEMNGIEHSNDAPWREISDQVTAAVIEEGVTSVGIYAFHECINMKSVVLPSTITTICDGAFNDCIQLQSLLLPESVTTIGNYAIQGCTSLKSITLPEGLTSIGQMAFEYCASLESIVIPEGIVKIPDWTFSDCAALETVVLPEGLQIIGEGAFHNCEALKSIHFPGSLISIGTNAFLGCGNASATYGGTIAQWLELSDFAMEVACSDGLIYGSGTCGSNLAWVITDTGVLNISGTGEMTDYSTWNSDAPWANVKDSITQVVIEEGVTSVGSGAFCECTNLEEVILPEGLTRIGEYAFRGCESLQELTIPDGITAIEEGSFQECSSLMELVIPEGVTSIGQYAFAGCGNLMELTLPATLAYVGAYAFPEGESGNLTVLNIQDLEAWCAIEFEEGWSNPMSSTGGFYMDGKLVTKLVIPETVTAIGDYAFYNCKALTHISIPSTVTSIGDYAFYTNSGDNGKLTTATYGGTLEEWIDHGYSGVLDTTCADGGRVLGRGECGTKTTWVISPDGELRISGTGTMSFEDAWYGVPWWPAYQIVESVVVEAGVTSIAGEAFSALHMLETITIGPDVKMIGNWGIAHCWELQSLIFLGDAPTIGADNFYGMNGWAYYPAGNDTWTEDKLGQYQAESIAWIPYEDLSDINVTGPILLTGTQTQLVGGKSTQLTADLYGQEFRYSLKWMVSDPALASVSSSGKVTAKAVTDACTVDVAVVAYKSSDSYVKNWEYSMLDQLPNGCMYATYSLDLVPAAASLVIYDAAGAAVTGATVSYDMNDKSLTGMTFAALTLPVDAQDGITWSCSDTKGSYLDFTDNGDGTVTVSGAKKTGTVTLTAKAADGSGKSAKVKVKIVKLADAIQVTNAPEWLRGGASVVLKTDIASNKELTSKSVIWSVDDASVPYAAITNGGKLTTRAVSEQHTITVSVCAKENPEAKTSIQITLYPAVESVVIRKDGVTLKNNQTLTMDRSDTLSFTTASFPAESNQQGTWTSSNKKVAEMSADGTVIAKKNGTVTFNFKAADGSNKTAKVKVKIAELTESVTISPETGIELRSGKTTKLLETLTAYNENGEPIPPTTKTVTWTSSDPTVATVSTKGKVTAKTVYENKTVTITATAKDGTGKSAQVEVLVRPKLDDTLIIRCDEENVTGKTIEINLLDSWYPDLMAKLFNSPTALETEAEAKWTSSNKKVASFDEDGQLVVNAAGTTTISAKADGQTAKFTLKVAKHSAYLEVSSKTGADEVVSGKTLQLVADLTAADGTAPSNKGVTWTSSDPSVASVSTSGKVTAKKVYTATTVRITALAKDGHSEADFIDLTVRPAARTLSVLDGSGRVLNNRTVELDMDLDTELTVYARAYPWPDAMQEMTWSSSNKKVAKVDSDGHITALKPGTTVIKATAKDGSKKSVSFTLVVVNRVKLVEVVNETLEVKGGKKLTLKLEFDPVKPSNAKMTYAIRPEDAVYASISTKGVITAKKVTAPKTIQVTITPADNPAAAITVEVTILP